MTTQADPKLETHETPEGGETVDAPIDPLEDKRPSVAEQYPEGTLERDDSSTAPVDQAAKPGPIRDDSTMAPADGAPARTGPARPDSTMVGQEPPPDEDVEEEDDLESNTIEQLREIASEEDVDLTGLTLKADIVEAIEDHRSK